MSRFYAQSLLIALAVIVCGLPRLNTVAADVALSAGSPYTLTLVNGYANQMFFYNPSHQGYQYGPTNITWTFTTGAMSHPVKFLYQLGSRPTSVAADHVVETASSGAFQYETIGYNTLFLLVYSSFQQSFSVTLLIREGTLPATYPAAFNYPYGNAYAAPYCTWGISGLWYQFSWTTVSMYSNLVNVDLVEPLTRNRLMSVAKQAPATQAVTILSTHLSDLAAANRTVFAVMVTVAADPMMALWSTNITLAAPLSFVSPKAGTCFVSCFFLLLFELACVFNQR
jgi:hypothetical protein